MKLKNMYFNLKLQLKLLSMGIFRVCHAHLFVKLGSTFCNVTMMPITLMTKYSLKETCLKHKTKGIYEKSKRITQKHTCHAATFY